MTARQILLFILLLSIRSSASPGEVIPLNHPIFRAVGTVGATAITLNGEVFIAGDFDQVNGIPRPGLAKLTQNGALDQSFQPSVAPANLISSTFFPVSYRPLQNAAFWNTTYPFYLQNEPGTYENLQLFDLDQGRLFMRNHEAWTVLDSSGEVDLQALPSFSRNDPAPVPQFRRGNQLFLIDHQNQLSAIDLQNNDALDESFTLDPNFQGSILQAAPSIDGTWLLSRQGQFNVVCHLLSDGTLDPAFPPLELRDGQSHRLSSNSFSGFSITSFPGLSYLTCHALGGCGPTLNIVNLQWFSQTGNELSETQIRTQGYSSPLVLFQSSSRTIYQQNGHWYLKFPTSEPILFDQIHKPSPNASSTLPLQVSTVDEFSSGFQRSLLIGGTRLFNQSGIPSSFWQTPSLTRAASISKVIPQPNGSYFVSGDFGQGLARVNADGTIDSNFRPTIDLRFLQDFEVKKNGELFVLLKEPYVDTNGDPRSLLRLSATGELQQAYLDALPSASIYNIQLELLSDQSLIFGDRSQNYIFTTLDGTLVENSLQRIQPNGEPDPDWEMTPPFSINRLGLFTNSELLALADGSFLFGRQQVSAEGAVTPGIPGDGEVRLFGQDAEGWVYFINGSNYSIPTTNQKNFLQRWNPDHGLDPDFAFSLEANYRSISKITFGSRRKLYLHGLFRSASGQRTLIRLHHSGQIDHSFREPDLSVSTVPNHVQQLLTRDGLALTSQVGFPTTAQATSSFVHDDQLFLFGVFDQPSPNIIALEDTHVAGFTDWITATTGEAQEPNDDYDKDGASNLEEYALGSDPAFPDLSAHQIAHTAPNIFEVPCNPEAPEVIRQLEVSLDLANWKIANASEITLETLAGCLRYRLDAPRPRIFSRIRYALR